MRGVAIVGCGMTRFGQLEDKSLTDLMVESSLRAISDANASESDFDAVYVGNMFSGEFNRMTGIASVLADRLNLLPAAADKIENGPASGGSAIKEGFQAIASGISNLVLVVGVEKMTSIPNPKVSSSVATLTHPTAEYKYGVTLPSLGGLLAQLYLKKYNVKRELLSLVAVKNHKNGAHNPYAHFQKEITLEKALASPVIADPLRLFDVCPVSDGAASLVLCAADKAKEYTDTPVFIKGFGQATDIQMVAEREDPTVLGALREAARKAYSMAKLEPQDIDFAELHDAFTILEIVQSEDVGFFRKGEGAKAVEEGKTWLDGELPINPSGGLKARGHPLGATGVAQAVEITWQLRGEAGKRQVPECETGLSVNFGGFGNNIVVHIFQR
ncbi:MAG: thiolase domain-containing protein [Candidatus Jordarchaeaceae archaeon]